MLPEKWLVKTNEDENHPVLKYLNEKCSTDLAGSYLYYGLDKNSIVFLDSVPSLYSNFTILSTEQFLEMITEKEVWKKDDILSSGNVFRKILKVLDDIIFTSNAYTILEKAENCDGIDIVSRKYLENKEYKLYIPQPSTVVELTLEEIADKFGVDVENLKIKK